MLTRRQFIHSVAVAGGTLGLQGVLPAWARNAWETPKGERPIGGENGTLSSSLTGGVFDLHIDRMPVSIGGRKGSGIAVNGSLPAPLLRWREGETITLHVTNHLEEDTSIHWHGILLPFEMDGVPGVTFPGIKPGETFTYRFPVRQSGTYWYHSHSGLQEQLGHYGPLIIDPAESDPVLYDREHVLVLSDWAFEDPQKIFQKLKKSSDSFNFQKRSATDFLRDARQKGLGVALKDRLAWGAMRMDPTDIADVTGATYIYLVNGHGPDDAWTGLFTAGEKLRLRIINASAMSFFNIRIPGLPMTVVQADGMNVQPLDIDEFQIGVAETYDVIVQPREDRAYTVMCESIDRNGFGRATLAPRLGMSAPVPPLRQRPLLTMKDMGMASHGAMEPMDHTGGGHELMNHGAMKQGQMAKTARHDTVAQRHDHPMGPGVANLAMAPQNRLDEPGIGLADVGHRTLTYADLRSLAPIPDTRPPGREIELHLTSNMERYMWSFDGVQFSEVTRPIVFHYGERLRLTMVNDTMMPHPIHLHGMFFQVVNGGGDHMPSKHTITVKPGEKLSVDVTADAPGDWAFHCHLLYHMHAGMFQVVSVQKAPRAPHPPHHTMAP